MKTSYCLNFVLFVFIHLAVFLFPLASKTLHVHHNEHEHSLFSTNTTVGEPEDYCPIFDFDFFSFVSTAPINTCVALTGLPVQNSSAPEAVFIPVVAYFSLRAPPVA